MMAMMATASASATARPITSVVDVLDERFASSVVLVDDADTFSGFVVTASIDIVKVDGLAIKVVVFRDVAAIAAVGIATDDVNVKVSKGDAPEGNTLVKHGIAYPHELLALTHMPDPHIKQPAAQHALNDPPDICE
jgi:hypothetical protein